MGTETLLEGFFYIIGYVGAFFHWLFFLGKRPFSKVLRYPFINGLITIAILVIVFFLFKEEILRFFLGLLKQKIEDATHG